MTYMSYVIHTQVMQNQRCVPAVLQRSRLQTTWYELRVLGVRSSLTPDASTCTLPVKHNVVVFVSWESTEFPDFVPVKSLRTPLEKRVWWRRFMWIYVEHTKFCWWYLQSQSTTNRFIARWFLGLQYTTNKTRFWVLHAYTWEHLRCLALWFVRC